MKIHTLLDLQRIISTREDLVLFYISDVVDRLSTSLSLHCLDDNHDVLKYLCMRINIEGYHSFLDNIKSFYNIVNIDDFLYYLYLMKDTSSLSALCSATYGYKAYLSLVSGDSKTCRIYLALMNRALYKFYASILEDKCNFYTFKISEERSQMLYIYYILGVIQK